MSRILVNGAEDTCIDVRDRGFQYGDGVFETIAFQNNQLQLWDEHMQRMQLACQRLSLPMIDEAVWLADLGKLSLQQDAVIKLSISRGISGRGYAYDQSDGAPDSVTRVAAVNPWPNYAEANQQGVTARFCKTPVSMNPSLAGIKHLNRLDNVLARNEWHDSQITEGFMLDSQQHVIEGTMSNVFCVLGNELYTPLLEQSGVAGVMREQLVNVAKKIDIPVNVIEISKQNFIQMDEIFITNSVIGLWPVKKIIDGDVVTELSRNDLTEKLQKALYQSIKGKSL